MLKPIPVPQAAGYIDIYIVICIIGILYSEEHYKKYIRSILQKNHYICNVYSILYLENINKNECIYSISDVLF